jgi:small-conductance mechanosensitive channel
MEQIKEFLNTSFQISDKITISVKDILILIAVLLVAKILTNLIKSVVTRKMPKGDAKKFRVVFSYVQWFTYFVILLITFHALGVNLSGVLAASAALLIGIGLALQTLFQDIISGVFILIDQSVHVGDIIEIEGKVGRVEEIKLRTTRAVTIDNKVLVIPNHLYLANSLYNWTQNGTITRESVEVGVAYGSDVQKVKSLLLEAASNHPNILKDPPPLVLFTNFGDSSLNFRLIVSLNDSFQGAIPRSDLRFEIDRLFRENNITIPFPQRDIHIKEK